jgi:hypothetical protein
MSLSEFLLPRRLGRRFSLKFEKNKAVKRQKHQQIQEYPRNQKQQQQLPALDPNLPPFR